MAVTTAFERVCDALQRAGKTVGNGDRSRAAQCPAHDDRRASLSVTASTGHALIHCHAGCLTTDVLHAIGLTTSDLFDEPRQSAGNASWSPYGEVVAAYDYVDATGHLLFQVCRTADKQFPLRRPDRTAKSGWSWKLGNTPRVLYRLPAVLAAVAESTTVFIVEGEKDVHAAEAAGYTATCNPGGAGSWRHEYADTLAGAEVVVICDRDKPGRAHGRMVAASLRGIAELVRLVEPVEGKDLSDHLAAGHSIEQLSLVAEDPDDAPPPPEPPEEEGNQPVSALDLLRSYVLSGDQVEAIPPPEPLVAEWLDLESLAVLYGRPGGGKSFLAIDIALHVATSSWWHHYAVAGGNVLYVAAEGRRGLGIRQRAWRMHNRHHAPIPNIRWLPRAVNLLDPVNAQALIELAAEVQPTLVVIDTLARSMIGGDENASRDMGRAVDAADRIKHRTGACVLLVHHSGKDQAQGARGHSSLLGAVDTELELKNAGDGILTLANTKQKESIEQAPLRFTLVPTDDSAAIGRYSGRGGIDSVISQKALVTLDALRAISLPGGVPTTTWREKASGDGTGRSTFYEHVKTLVDRRLVQNIGTDKRPLYIPSDQGEHQ